jgi:nitrite reductase/ring-hydroxylating ferredoxin subunit
VAKYPERIVAQLDAIEEPGARDFSGNDPDWPFRGLIVRWRGEVFAYANSCAHLGHPLNLAPGRFFDAGNKLLLCSSHGAMFEPDTGACVKGPCLGKQLIELSCRVDGNDIYVCAPGSQREMPGPTD